MLGGMGVDISNTELALEIVRLGGIGHISDAMIHTITDRRYDTSYAKEKLEKYKLNIGENNKSVVQFDLKHLAEATRLHVSNTMKRKQGPGLVFINCMEKLSMGNPTDTLQVRLRAAMDAGIEGISLSAGLHLGSFNLIKDHPRFRETSLGIIVSSVRALKLFLRKTAGLDRLPDFIVVEGPLAGGHLGFGIDDWQEYRLEDLTRELLEYLKQENLDIPLIPAGGIFDAADALRYMEMGTAAVQVATRFTIAKECGLPDKVKQEYLRANADDIEVNMVSPTGYPMRMLKSSPAIGSGIRPACEQYGYLLDRKGNCSYIEAYNAEVDKNGKEVHVQDKTCLCTQMRNFKCWTCGTTTCRLKETAKLLSDGTFELPMAEEIFNDYVF